MWKASRLTAAEIAGRIADGIDSWLTTTTVRSLLYETDDEVRTCQIKQRLCDLGHELGFRVCAHRNQCPEADEGEWLYDMEWCETSNDGHLFVRQPMVMECEWRRGVPLARAADVDGDFQKLVQAKADVRVWIFTAPNVDLAQEHLANCRKQMTSFVGSVAEDRYVLAALIYSNCTREIHHFPAFEK